jgi:hypothetical protein
MIGLPVHPAKDDDLNSEVLMTALPLNGDTDMIKRHPVSVPAMTSVTAAVQLRAW